MLPGEERAETVVELSRRAWSGLVHDVESPPSLVYHGEAASARGELMGFVRWEALLRAPYTGRPIYDADSLDLRDRRGAPLDPARGFALDDDPEDMAHFLREAGALRFLPGSWKASYRLADASDEDAPAGVLVPAEHGDLTIHYGDGWHAAPPPTSRTGPFRCCILVGFEREGAFNHRGERHYNDVLLGSEDGQVRNMTRMAAETD